MIYAVQGGLTVNEILGRTQVFAVFYGSFSSLGAWGNRLRVISFEWLG